MKDLLGIIKDWGVKPIIFGVGIFSIGLFGLSIIPSLSWVPKMFVLFVLTH